MTDTQLTTTHSQALLQSVLDPKYVRRLIPDPAGGFTATIHELPGCIAEGDTAEEALAQLDAVAHSWIESAKATGYPVTPPIDYEGASGKIALRISRRLHQLAAERADMEGTSLNQFIGNALANYLGQQDGMRRMAQQIEQAISASVHAIHVTFYNAQTRRETSSARIIFGHAEFLTQESSSKGLLPFSLSKHIEQPKLQHGQNR